MEKHHFNAETTETLHDLLDNLDPTGLSHYIAERYELFRINLV